MFLRFWFIWAFLGLSVATLIFWWAIQRGQFEDSRRAAFLPLDDVEPAPDARATPPERGGRLSLYVMLGIAALGVGVTLVTLVLALVS